MFVIIIKQLKESARNHKNTTIPSQLQSGNVYSNLDLLVCLCVWAVRLIWNQSDRIRMQYFAQTDSNVTGPVRCCVCWRFNCGFCSRHMFSDLGSWENVIQGSSQAMPHFSQWTLSIIVNFVFEERIWTLLSNSTKSVTAIYVSKSEQHVLTLHSKHCSADWLFAFHLNEISRETSLTIWMMTNAVNVGS